MICFGCCPIETERSEFLGNERYRGAIEDLLATKRGLFFNREFNLNQGSYLTEAPLELVQIWNDIGPPAIRAKVSHASIKDTFWDILQNPDYLDQAERALDKWWPCEKRQTSLLV